MSFDLSLFNAINGLAGKWAWLDITGIFFAQHAGYVLLAILAALFFFKFQKHWRMAVEALIAAIMVRFVIVEIMRLVWFRARPFVNHSVHLLLPSQSPQEASFPSGHASFYFALSTIVYCYHKKLGIFFYIVSALIALSRVFVGVHWPSDVLVGAMVGVAMGLVLNKIFKKLKLGDIIQRYV